MLLQLKNLPKVGTNRNFYVSSTFGFLFTLTLAFFIISTNGENPTNEEKKYVLEPVLPKNDHQVAFGKVEGEERGDNLMDPPIYQNDPYFWLRDESRENQTIIHLMKTENRFTTQIMSRVQPLVNELKNDLLSRLKGNNLQERYLIGSYRYFYESESNKNYRLFYRKKNEESGVKELVLDINEVAEGFSYCSVDTILVSPDPDTVAYGVDLKGKEAYSIRFKDVITGEHWNDKLSGGKKSMFAWGKTKDTFYYVTSDKMNRANKLWKHTLGTSQSEDVCVYTEDNSSYEFEGVTRSRSEKMILIRIRSAETSEVLFIDLEKEDMGVQVIQKRIPGMYYKADHHQDKFFITTNIDNAINSKVVTAPVSSPDSTHWVDFVPYDPLISVSEVECFRDFIVIAGRQNGLAKLWTVQLNDEKKTMKGFEFDEPVYTVLFGKNYNFVTSKITFVYSSLRTPTITFELDVLSQERSMVTEDIRERGLITKQSISNYTLSLYETQRLEATADDGTKIPISIVFRKDLKKPTATNPLHLTGYGSYGIPHNPTFYPQYLPLLDRGFIYAIAHVRGGDSLGKSWHDSGKLLKKMNTFTDFINCAEHLIRSGWTEPSKLAIEGGSAGGLLVGAVVNMRPELFRVAIARKPFVDILTSLSDPSLPSTTQEWGEWGNPNQKVYYDYIKKYSPIDNVAPNSYPHMWITTALNDMRVPFWEPFKWVAKLRENNQGSSTILFDVELDGGHSGSTEKGQRLNSGVHMLAFILDHI